MYTIAIIDDDIHIGNMLEEALKKEGYEILRAYSGSEALMLLNLKTPDLVLLDLMLPGISGEDVLLKIKNIPVIIISAKIGVDDKVNMLLQGAVDYMTKPFDIKELSARVKVHLRQASPAFSRIIKEGNITLNQDELTFKYMDKEVKLTRTECAILKLLMENKNKVLSKNVILDRISIDTPDCTERSLKQHISNLRHKINNISGTDMIETIYGIGFKLNV